MGDRLVAFDAPLIAGILLAFSLAAPPGPANALMAQETVRRGYASGWLTGLGAVIGDVTLLMLTLLGTLRVVALFPWTSVVLATVGAGLMARFAWDAFRTARAPVLPAAAGAGGFFRSYLITATSPFNLAWWLTGGATLISQTGHLGIVGFLSGLLVWITAWNVLALLGARRFARFGEYVSYASALVLGAFSVLLAFFAVRGAWAFL